MKILAFNRDAIISKRMDIVIADCSPVAEFYAEFERCIRFAHENALINAKRLIEKSNMRQGRFADADSSDFICVDQCHADEVGVELVRKRRRRHPSGSAAADDTGRL